MVGSPVTDFIFREENDEDYEGYEARKKFPSGMIGFMRFEIVDCQFKYTTFNVVLDIRKKKNRPSPDRAVTGRDGLETASWALTTLSDFERYAPEIYPQYATRIEVGADEDRRWTVYERVLTKRGYNVTMVDGYKTLVKKIGAQNG